jgi:hypothetical protein
MKDKMKVVSHKPKANKDLIEQLEILLDDAKAGKIRAFVCVGVTDAGRLIHGYSVKRGSEEVLPMLGMLEVQKGRLIEKFIDLEPIIEVDGE